MPFDPDELQRHRNDPLPGDDTPVAPTAVQAQKIAAVMSAYLDRGPIWRYSKRRSA